MGLVRLVLLHLISKGVRVIEIRQGISLGRMNPLRLEVISHYGGQSIGLESQFGCSLTEGDILSNASRVSHS